MTTLIRIVGCTRCQLRQPRLMYVVDGRPSPGPHFLDIVDLHTYSLRKATNITHIS